MLKVQLSPGTNPVLTIETETLEELDDVLRELRQLDAFSALKGAAREFQDAPLAPVEQDALAALEAALPGAEIIVDSAADQLGPSEAQQFMDDWNAKATERAIERGQIERPAPPKVTDARPLRV